MIKTQKFRKRSRVRWQREAWRPIFRVLLLEAAILVRWRWCETGTILANFHILRVLSQHILAATHSNFFFNNKDKSFSHFIRKSGIFFHGTVTIHSFDRGIVCLASREPGCVAGSGIQFFECRLRCCFRRFHRNATFVVSFFQCFQILCFFCFLLHSLYPSPQNKFAGS